MSKARITYRFEHPRSPAGQAQTKMQTQTEVETREAKSERANVIPLRHVEFQLGEEPILVEEKKEPAEQGSSADLHQLNGYPYDFGAWNDPVVSEADQLERLIRESNESPYERPFGRGERRRGQAPFTQKSFDQHEQDDSDFYSGESGYWQPTRERSVSRMSRSRSKEGPPWWKVAASVIGAVATGVLFGSFILSMFTGQADEGAGSGLLESFPPAPVHDSQGPSVGTTGLTDELAAEPTAATIALPERRMFLLQNGVFQTLEGARALAEDMRAKGLAATIEQGQSFFVYAGVTTDREAALRAGRKLQEAGIEIYVKPYELPSVGQVRWSSDGSTEALHQYITQGSKMVRMIGDVTLIHLEGNEPVAPESTTVATLTSEHLRLTEVTAAAISGLPAEAQPMLKRMDAAIRTAVVAIEEYGAHPAHAYLWSAQSALMDYIIAEKQLLTTIAMK